MPPINIYTFRHNYINSTITLEVCGDLDKAKKVLTNLVLHVQDWTLITNKN